MAISFTEDPATPPEPLETEERRFGPHSLLLGRGILVAAKDPVAVARACTARLIALFVDEGCPEATAEGWVRSHSERFQRAEGVFEFRIPELVLTVPKGWDLNPPPPPEPVPPPICHCSAAKGEYVRRNGDGAWVCCNCSLPVEA